MIFLLINHEFILIKFIILKQFYFPRRNFMWVFLLLLLILLHSILLFLFAMFYLLFHAPKNKNKSAIFILHWLMFNPRENPVQRLSTVMGLFGWECWRTTMLAFLEVHVPFDLSVLWSLPLICSSCPEALAHSLWGWIMAIFKTADVTVPWYIYLLIDWIFIVRLKEG